MSAQVAADLRAAAEVLRRDGWTQGVYEDANGAHCLVGAFEVVCGSVDTHGLRLEFYRLTSELPLHFNDEPDRTADEVIAALLAAADAAEVVP